MCWSTQAAELEERGRLLYKTKAAIEGLQAELSKARENEQHFKEQARVAFTEQGESDGCPRAIATVWALPVRALDQGEG